LKKNSRELGQNLKLNSNSSVQFPRISTIKSVDCPESITPIQTYHQGEVVCSIALSNPFRYIFTGGKVFWFLLFCSHFEFEFLKIKLLNFLLIW